MGFVKDAELKISSKRSCSLEFDYEIGDEIRQCALTFSNVVSFRCTYHPALTIEMIKTSYDTLIELKNSEWLLLVRKEMKNCGFHFEVRHFRICFDDGPCYEFLSEHIEILT